MLRTGSAEDWIFCRTGHTRKAKSWSVLRVQGCGRVCNMLLAGRRIRRGEKHIYTHTHTTARAHTHRHTQRETEREREREREREGEEVGGSAVSGQEFAQELHML
jgi:hypothetical protein